MRRTDFCFCHKTKRRIDASKWITCHDIKDFLVRVTFNCDMFVCDRDLRRNTKMSKTRGAFPRKQSSSMPGVWSGVNTRGTSRRESRCWRVSERSTTFSWWRVFFLFLWQSHLFISCYKLQQLFQCIYIFYLFFKSECCLKIDSFCHLNVKPLIILSWHLNFVFNLV